VRPPGLPVIVSPNNTEENSVNYPHEPGAAIIPKDPGWELVASISIEVDSSSRVAGGLRATYSEAVDATVSDDAFKRPARRQR